MRDDGDLARRQAELVSALLGGGDAPAGFDEGRVRTAAAALRAKRAHAIAKAWPRLARALGPDLAPAVERHVRLLPSAPASGPLGDGRELARALAAEGRLPWEGRLELLAADLRHRWLVDGRRLPRRAAVAAAWRRAPAALVVAVRLPVLGERWLRLPLTSG
ncbi:MAG: hypothetical protein E6J41_26980 [Chloroflexi bacterium]|nr:MAG: hypothetical protein E6J41_26980 [Chloroflexota bacterium]